MHITELLLPLFVVVAVSIISVNGKSASKKLDPSAWKFKSLKNEGKINEYYKSSNTSSGNPFLYPCTSNSQCDIPGLNTCHMSPPNQPNTWFCDCYWSSEDFGCTKNKDCCTNICNNGHCATSGGLQGALCSPSHQDCAAGYICRPWGDVGYCDSGFTTTIRPTTTTRSTTTTRGTTTTTTRRTTITTTSRRTTTATTRRTTTTTPFASHNPYLYPCTTDSDCTNSLHSCVNVDNGGGSDPNGWFCKCWWPWSTERCEMDADCCSNICNSDGTCALVGGAGTVCRTSNGFEQGCESGCECIHYDYYGYCQC